MQDLVQYITRLLVDHPDELKITSVNGEKTTMFELRCHAEDVGKIIGRSGKTVGALRTLLTTMAAKQGRRAVLEVVE